MIINNSINNPEWEPHAIILPWILRLRWGSVATQALMVIMIRFAVDFDLPLAPLMLLIAFQGAGNFLLTAFSRREKTARLLFPGAMFADIILFTLVLAYTGGPMNPFTFFYLVHVTIGAMFMTPAAATGLSLTAIGCYALLFLVPRPPAASLQPSCHLPGLDPAMLLHLKGMWLAFAVTSLAVILFVGRIRRNINEHRLAVETLKEESARHEKLASLATLAAGAAHELSTPLSTIAVAAAELEDELIQLPAGGGLRDDAGLIRAEVKKCKEILSRMAGDAGETPGEPLTRVRAEGFLKNICETADLPGGAIIECLTPDPGLAPLVPKTVIARTIKALIKNSLDAEADRIKITCRRAEAMIEFTVSDNGQGMDETVRERAAEPFYTTKEAGRGMGLGLYLARTLAEQLGGRLEIESQKGEGATVRLLIPEKTSESVTENND